MEVTGAYTCPKCGQAADSPGRCKPCAALATRICRACEGNAWLNEHWKGNLAKDTFHDKALNLYGADLEKLMVSTMEEVLRTKHAVQFQGTGSFFDEVQLGEKYKNNPRRLEAVLQYGQQFTCPKTNITLYEDLQYQRTFASSASHESEEKRRCTTEDKVKKAKKAKVSSPVSQNADAAQGEPKDLSSSQLESLTKWMTDGEKLNKTLTDAVAELNADEKPKWATFMPPRVVSFAKAKLELWDAHKGLIEMTKESKKHASFSAFAKEQGTVKKDMQEAARKWKLQKQEAESMVE